jgi:hypothetical protein
MTSVIASALVVGRATRTTPMIASRTAQRTWMKNAVQ